MFKQAKQLPQLFKRSRFRVGIAVWMAGLAALLWSGSSAFALNITNVSAVNITPVSFSVLWAGTPSITPGISVFSDAGGVTNLAGKIRVEFYPLHTGDPLATNAYDRRLKQAIIRQKSQNLGVVEVRVTGCTPNTTYYYRLQVSNGGQSSVFPVSGPLPAVTTAVENSFVVQSRQLVVSLPGLDPSGTIVTLQNSNTPSVLAAVAGDGVPGNQVFFSVTDLISALGQTNYLPLGDQEFVVKVAGSSTNAETQTYSLNFNTDFLVGQGNSVAVGGQFVALSIGSIVARAGTTSSIPFQFQANGVTNLSFTLDLPTNRFTSLDLQALAPQLGSASLQFVASNRLSLTFKTVAGQSLQGNQKIAALNFTLVSNQSSAFLPLTPKSLTLSSVDALAVTNLAVLAGRLVVVGNEPLLETTLGDNQTRNLSLYGKPWASYEIQSSTNLADSHAWAHLMRVPMTNLVETFPGLDTSKSSVFYRAYEFIVTNSLLDGIAGGQLTIYGAPLSAYVVEYASGLSIPAQWNLLTRVPMTNSFRLLNGFPASQNVFYRSRILDAEPPALDASMTGSNRSLMVYGRTGTNYTVQYGTNISGVVTWHPLLSYTLTNAFQSIPIPGGTGSNIFYRVKH